MNTLRALTFTAILLVTAALPALGTNGMLIEGYGPISHALGGASMAFDNGNSGMANNPATLGLMPQGNRLDLAVGMLLPNVTFKQPHKNYDSEGKRFFMPAAGFVRRQGDWSYGIGAFSQGGMGTDYLHDLGMFAQVVVGKVLIPVSYNVTEKLSLGLTLEYLWADMDLVMSHPMMGRIFDFKDDSNSTGAAKGEGYSGKLGALYKITDWLNVGAAYQHKGGIGDLTGRGARVKGFDLPASLSGGFAVWPIKSLMFTVDYNRIFWSQSMRTITVSQNGFSMPMKQNWNDQDVWSFGVAYEALPGLTLRAGASIANNPIKSYNTPLFPAIIENHYTTGFGYKFNENHSIDASFAYAPRVTQSNGPDFPHTSTTHSQTSFQLMYSLQF